MKITLNRFLKFELAAIAVLTLYTFLSVKALFHVGFFRTTDDVTTVRIIQMKNELQRQRLFDNFPVRLAGELAHKAGYPLFLFYAPLPYYAGALSMLFFGLSGIVASKFVYAIPLITGGFFFYAAVRQRLPSIAAAFSAVLFILFPYRGYNVYERGGVGESWAISFIPLAFFGIFLLKKRKQLGAAIIAIATAATLISHNLVGLQFLCLISLYGLFFYRREKFYWLAIALGLGLATFYLVPMLFYLDQVQVLNTAPNTGKILTSFEPFSYLFQVSHSFILNTKYSAVFTYLLLIASFLLFFKRKQLPSLIKWHLLFWLSNSYVLLFLLTQPSYKIWEAFLPITQILQFSWRILSILAFVIPFTLANCFRLIETKISQFVLFLFVLMFSSQLLPIFKPKEYIYFYEYRADSTSCATTTWEDEFLPKSVDDCITSERPFIEQGNNISVVTDTPNLLSADSSSDKKQVVQVNKYFIPGWVVEVDGSETKIEKSRLASGTFSFVLPAGNHSLQIRYTKTTLMILSDLVSLLSLVILLRLLVKSKT